MIWGEWVDPNFHFVATDEQGQKYEYVCYAADKDTLLKRLNAKSLTVVDPEHDIQDYDFNDWNFRTAPT